MAKVPQSDRIQLNPTTFHRINQAEVKSHCIKNAREYQNFNTYFVFTVQCCTSAMFFDFYVITFLVIWDFDPRKGSHREKKLHLSLNFKYKKKLKIIVWTNFYKYFYIK